MKSILTFILALASTIAFATTPLEYVDLQESAKTRLSIAFKSGKSAEITAAASVVDGLARARYLDGMSHINEAFMPFIDGFAPQIAALPDGLKQIGVGVILTNKEIPPFAADLLIRFLQAQNATAAKEALGDIIPVIKALQAGDQARSAVYSKAPPNQDFEKTQREAQRVATTVADITYRTAKEAVGK